MEPREKIYKLSLKKFLLPLTFLVYEAGLLSN